MAIKAMSYEDEQEIIRTGRSITGKVEMGSHKSEPQTTWCITSKMPLRNAKGEIIGTFGLSRDITDLKRAELEFRSLAENLPDNIFRWDSQGRYIYVNPTIERTTSVNGSDVYGK